MLNTEENKILRCGIYTRKSTEKGLELEYNSLQFQFDSCMSHITAQPNLTFIEYYEDSAISGKDTKNRPGFMDMMKDVKNKFIDCIVVYKLDRLSRSVIDLANLVEHLGSMDASFISVTQPIDTSNSSGRLSFNMLAVIAQFEREISSERVRDKIASARIKGYWTGGAVPYGYINEDKKLVIDETEASIVKDIYQNFLKHYSTYGIHAYLLKNNIKTKTGTNFRITGIKQILTNPIYNGKIHYKGKYYSGIHKGIILNKDWKKVQEIMENKDKYIPQNPTKPNEKRDSCLLIGKLFCGACYTKMDFTFSRNRGITYKYYICSKYAECKQECNCTTKRIPIKKIEKLVMDKIFKILKSENIVNNIIKNSPQLSEKKY